MLHVLDRVTASLKGYHENKFNRSSFTGRFVGPPFRVFRPRGRPQLAPTGSDFAGQAVVQTGTVTISDREGIVIVSRSFVYEGATETFFYRDLTDADNNATIHSGKDLKSKTRWDHDVLKVTTTNYGAITVESYALAPDGTMTVNVVRPEHQPITLVFQRK